jgi:hypothetical protein
MKGENLKKLRVFAASPSDVATERADSLKLITDYLGLIFKIVHWFRAVARICSVRKSF